MSRTPRQPTESEPAGAIVVGSATTALLMEALALAGKLPCGPSRAGVTGYRSPNILRAESWTAATPIAAGIASCVAIAGPGVTGPAQPLRDAGGRAVAVLAADDLLERARGDDVGMAPAVARRHRRHHLTGIGLLPLERITRLLSWARPRLVTPNRSAPE